MLPNVQTELTDEQIAALETARKTIPALKAQIKRAADAGIDVAQQKADLLALETQLERLYRVYVKRLPTGASISTTLPG